MAKRSKKKTFWAREKEGVKRVGGLAVQFGKELSTIPAYAARELTGQRHGKKPKCTLKKGWFE